MYSYKEEVRKDVKNWMEENKDQWQGLDRHDAFDAVYDACWEDDSVTGNASGSYTFSRWEARQNFFNDVDAEEYLYQACEDSFFGCGDYWKASDCVQL